MENTEKMYSGAEGLIDFVLHGQGNAIVDAVAGAGKSSTARKCIKLLPKNLRILFISFNKEVANKNRKELGPECTNTDVRTLHSIGLAVLQENLHGATQDDNKYKTLLRENLDEITDTTPGEVGGFSYFTKYKDNIEKIFDFARSNMATTLEEVVSVSEKYDITPIADECFAVIKLMEWGKKHCEIFDFTDMIWLPVALGMTTSKYKYDFIFIDEAQDTTIMAQRMVDILKHSGTRFVAIGDVFQCINSWCGADSDAFNSFMKYENTIRIDMHKSYRCKASVRDYLHEIGLVPHFDVYPNEDKGEVRFDVNPNLPVSGDMVLARFKSVAVQYYMYCLNCNKKAVYVTDKLYINQLIDMIESTGKDNLGSDLNEDGVFIRLYDRLFKDIASYQKKYKVEYEEAVVSEEIKDFYDNIKTLETIAQSLTRAEDLKNKIKDIFSQQNGDGIQISTVHRAKGDESDNVYIVGYSLMPSPLAHKDWQHQEEKNLIYVACTRAKKILNFVDEKLFPTSLFYSRKDLFLSEIERIHGIVEFVLQEEYNKEKAKLLRETKVEVPVVKQITTRKVGGKKFDMFH